MLILSRINIRRMENGEIMNEITKKAKEFISDMNIDMAYYVKRTELRIRIIFF